MAFRDNFGNPQGFIGKLMLSGMNMGHSPMAKWAFTQFDVPDDGKLVDIGCGGGFNIRRLLERSRDGFVYGIDISSTSVEKSKKMNKKNIGKICEVLLGSADNLPLEGNSIKLAIAFETVYFWENLEKCFAEVKRTLKQDRKFVVVNDSGAPEKHWEKRIPGMKSYTPDEIKQAMEAVGFIDVKATKKKFMFCVSGEKGKCSMDSCQLFMVRREIKLL